jgi:hypothetical protein
MRCLTLTQPWASLVAIGAKKIETRSWPTNYRGPLAIHAAKGFPRWARETCLDSPFIQALHRANYLSDPRLNRRRENAAKWDSIPLSSVLATCTLVDCVQMHEFWYRQGDPPALGLGKYTQMLADNPNEREFGDYADGRWAWILADVECFEQPVPAKGALGLWEWTPPEVKP